METIKNGSPFGYVHRDIEVPENLLEAFAGFSPLFKNINVGWDDIDPFMKKMLRKKNFYFNLGECSYQAISCKMEQSLHSCFFLI